MTTRILRIELRRSAALWAARLAARAASRPSDVDRMLQAMTAPTPGAAGVPALVAESLAALQSLPADEQRARVAAMREASMVCDGRDLLDILAGRPQ